MTAQRAIVLHEWRTQLRGVPFAALVLMLIGAAATLNPVAMIPGGGDVTRPVRAVANSVYALAPTFAMSAFFVYPFFVALMAGLSVLRDEECGITELVHSTPLTRAEYMWGKFFGVALTLLTAMAIHLMVVMGAREAGIGAIVRGPFHPTAYLLPMLWFVLPGVLWMAGLTFALGARTTSALLVYVLPVGLFVLEFMLLWNWHPRDIHPVVDAALMIVDPTGLRWLTHRLFTDERPMTWYNTAPLAIDHLLVAGRCVTALVPLAAVAWVARRPRPRTWWAWGWLARRVTRPRHSATASAITPRAESRPTPLAHTVAMQMRTPTSLGAARTIWAAECRMLLRQPTLYLFAALLFAVITEVGGTEVDAYGSTAVLTGGGIAIAALPVVTVLTCLFLLVVVVESLHRDRATGFDVIALSTPISTGALIGGHALAGLTVIVGVTVICIASGAVLLLSQSAGPVAWWPLALVFGGVLTPTYLLWIAFVTMVSTITRSRPAAIAVGLVALLLTAAQFMRGAMTWVSNWPLWGTLRWTEFAVFPLDGDALLLNRLLALSLALLLFASARWLFVRTEADPVAARQRAWRARWLRPAMRLAPLAALPAFTGGLLAVRVHNAFDTPRLVDAPRTEDRPLPAATIEHIEATVDVRPAQRGLGVTGTYDLVNRTSAALSAMPFTVPRSFGRVQWFVDGEPVTAQGTVGSVILPLVRSLPPGDRVQVGFAYQAVINAGISRSGGPVDAFVLPFGLLVSTHRGDFLPVPGHQTVAASGFQPVLYTAPTDADDLPDLFNGGWSFTATVRVDAPRRLTVNGVGERTATRVRGDRHIAVWETRVPVAALSLSAADYAVQRGEGVAVFHHPTHTQSLSVITQTLAAARRHYAAWFSPYPWSELRLSEVADLSGQATSYPTHIVFSEGLGFLTRDGPEGGLAFAVTAHEAAHQWWGHLLAAGHGPGSGVLVEGMADFATLLLYDAERGARARQAYARVLERQYLDARAKTAEQPLHLTSERSDADAAILQKKGAWAMWMLYRELGPTRMFPALQAFIAAHRAPGRFASLPGLLDTLRAHAGDVASFDRERRQWFDQTGLPAFSVLDPRCAWIALTQQWRCQASVRNDGTADATVEVAAMLQDRPMASGVRTVAIARGMRVSLTWILDKRPDRVTVDPDVQLLQVGREHATAPVR